MVLKNLLSKKAGMIAGAIVLLYALVGFFLLPFLAKTLLQDKLSIALNRDVLIEKIRVNPFALTSEIDKLVIKDKNNDVFVSAGKISANLSVSSLFTFTLVVSDFSLDDPYVNIIKNKDDSFNFSDLYPSRDTPQPVVENQNDTDKKIFRFILNNVRITRGEIRFADKKAKVSHLVNNFSLTLPHLSSNRKNRYEASSLDAECVFNQAKVFIEVESTPFAEDLATQVHIKATDIDVVHYLSYLPIPGTLELTDADVNLDLSTTYRKKKADHSLLLEGQVTVLNFDVKEALKQDLVNFPKLSIDILKSDILANELNISKVLLTKPQVTIKRDQTGQLNLFAHIPKENKESKANTLTEKGEENPFVLKLKAFDIKDAAIFFQDDSNKNVFNSKIYPLNLQVLNLEAGKRVSGEYRVTAKTEAEEGIASNGGFQTQPVKVQGVLKASNLMLVKYAPYYENIAGFDVQNGQVSLESGFDLSQIKEAIEGVINTKEFRIQSLSILDSETKEDIITVPDFIVNGSVIDLGKKTIDTGSIHTKNGKILVKRLKNGQMNLITCFQPPKDEPLLSASANGEMPTSSSYPAPPWAITLNAFDLSGFHVLFKDLTNTDPVSIDLSNIFMTAADLKTIDENPGSITAGLTWNNRGKIQVKGSLIPSREKAELDIKMDKLNIKSMQPYFTDAIRILVTEGDINTKGKLELDMEKSSKQLVRFSGETSVTNFISLDKKTAQNFFKCNSFYLSGIDFSVFPINLKVKEISMTDFYSRIFISENGEVNLSTILNKNTLDSQFDASEKNKENTSTDPSEIQIENITLQGGTISFSDYHTQPNFTAGMKQIAGAVTGLSSDEQSRAKFHLQGLHGQSSPLDIVGTLNLLSQKLFADIDISFKDIELANFTPYSSKYLGYKIEKGKLILDLAYLIEGKKLSSENRVRFDNFELGESVKSEYATSLPISLAVSLLKNRAGEIDLDLPVSGELDDPEFKIGSIIFKMIGNLIFKVVTSPFSIIGSMFGGGEELSFVDFAYGEKIIEASDFEKLDTLATILKEKPSVKLEIQGLYDPLRDAEGLKIKGFQNLLKTLKLKEMIASGDSPGTLDDVIVEDQEISRYIDLAYEQGEFPKPRDDAGLEKKVDTEEKKKLLMTNIPIGKDDLILLSMNRSENIKAYLISSGKVEKERIFLLEPQENETSSTDRTSKVKFLLK